MTPQNIYECSELQKFDSKLFCYCFIFTKRSCLQIEPRLILILFSSEIERRGVECGVQVCECVEEGREVKGMLGMVVETLINLIKENKDLDKMLILILEDRTDLLEVFYYYYNYYCYFIIL